MYRIGLDSEAYAKGTISFGGYSVSDLAEGQYRVIAKPYGATHFPQIYSGHSCQLDGVPNCDLGAGDVIKIVGTERINGIDFALENRFGVSGKVRLMGSGTNANVGLQLWQVQRAIELPTLVSSQITADSGQFVFNLQGLGAQRYFISTSAPNSYLNQIYSEIGCPQGNSALLGTCSFTDSSMIQLPATAVGQFTNINFTLDKAANPEIYLDDGFE